MKRFKVLLIFTVFLMVGCGSPSSNTDQVPTPTPPGTPGGPVNPPPPQGPDSRLPNQYLSVATTITLSDKTFGGLRDFNPSFSGSLIGDALGAVQLASGNAMIAMEDPDKFWAALIPYVQGTATTNNQTFDAIFSDNITARIVGQVSGNDILNGKIYYRVRGSGETQCLPVIVTCEVYGSFPGSYYGNQFAPQCDNMQVDIVTPCKAYMNLDLNLPELGSFTAKGLRTQWVSQ
ncbi:MAG: hypothetical protein HY537_12985 [Deltaproteobacteria bacterium]|nr:hypothetical protein [Deltaproteobacteria bacterium]